jgi:hypothetical protein
VQELELKKYLKFVNEEFQNAIHFYSFEKNELKGCNFNGNA